MLLLQTRLLGFVVLCFCWVTFVVNAQEANEVSISGTLMMLDDKTPHVACVIQVLTPALDGKVEPTVVSTTLSDENGKYQFVNLKSGGYQVRCYTQNDYNYYQDSAILQLKYREPLTNIDFRFPPFKKGTWQTITTFDGLADNRVNAIYQDTQGIMWFGT